MNISTLVRKAKSLFDNFTREMETSCISYIEKRNSELHSGLLSFDDIDSSTWEPMFYLICKTLLEEMNETLESLFGEAIAEEAEECIQAREDENIKLVKELIKKYKKKWKAKEKQEQNELSKQAKLTSTRDIGHRVDCPSCNSIALIEGKTIGLPISEVIEEEGIRVKQNMQPSSLKCSACGLKIIGYSKLLMCNLGGSYTSTKIHDPIDYFNIDIAEEYLGTMEEDFND